MEYQQGHKSTNKWILCFALLFHLCSCLTAGTHGSVKSYTFSVSKDALQKTVEQIISTSADIHRDTARNYIINITNGKNDTIWNDRYNDGQNYVTIKIVDSIKDKESEFTFQYVGDEKDWNTSNTSSLSITYAYNESGNGGVSQNGEVSSSPSLRKCLISLFETKLINRIKAELREK